VAFVILENDSQRRAAIGGIPQQSLIGFGSGGLIDNGLPLLIHMEDVRPERFARARADAGCSIHTNSHTMLKTFLTVLPIRSDRR